MGVRKWTDIKRKRFSAGELAASQAQAEDEVLDMNLRALREISGKTQTEIGAAVEMTQSQLSRLEHRDDHLVSTLRRYVEALGGQLEVVARFDDKSVRLRGV